MEGEPILEKLGDNDLMEMPVKRPDKAFIIADQSRPGFVPYIQELEYTHYVPDTERNGLFELVAVKWEGMVWFVVIVPMTELEIAVELGKQYNFRFAQGLIPILIGGGHEGPTSFPIKEGNNVFSIQGFIEDEKKVADLIQKMSKVIDDHAEAIRMSDLSAKQ